MTAVHLHPSLAPSCPRSAPAAGARTAFRALLLRDLVVVRKTWKEVLPRTLIQPFLLVFVFAYVFPKIGQGIGGRGGESEFSTLLVAGVIGLAIMFQGIQSVALPMVQEFGYTREIEDRVQAPLPVSMLAVEKAVAGALNGLFAAVLVFPIAAIVPATPVHLDVNWLELLTIVPHRLLHVWCARAHVRHAVPAADGAHAVRHLRAADHVLGRRLLQLVDARAGAVGADHRAREPARVLVRRPPRRAHHQPAHELVGGVSRPCSASRRCSPGSESTASRSAS